VIFEVRRHSLRGGGDGLSPAGLELARRAAGTLAGNYGATYTSPKPRCIETLGALGFESYKVIPEFSTLPAGLSAHDHHVEALQSRTGCSLLEAYLTIPATHLVLEAFGEAFFGKVCELAQALPRGKNALAISHGGSIEPAVLAAMPEWSLEGMGGPLAECDAALFHFEDKIFTRVELLRL
jgi:broad specificity phosphatase PhoE